ncbi:MAG TPA: nitroreductase family deazaflavin-dependent oxidoreductase [Nitriliruptoraceae bacterium]|nr:nitroreductase family deazaflavin-dependent oxidoreductase [Nitriliruptoraceae bacterium]
MTDVNDWNAQVIEEFRANEGKVGGQFEGAPLLLLHSTGRKSGKERVNPMMYMAVDGSWAVFASKAGADTHPDWFHNLVDNPDASIEVGTETHEVRARVTTGEEREEIWTRQKQAYPGFAEYEAKTDRVIPVIILEPNA